MNTSYYALFSNSECGKFIEINFPDLVGCRTYYPIDDYYSLFISDLKEFASACLDDWINNADEEFIKQPSSYDEIKNMNPNNALIVLITL